MVFCYVIDFLSFVSDISPLNIKTTRLYLMRSINSILLQGVWDPEGQDPVPYITPRLLGLAEQPSSACLITFQQVHIH